MGLTINGYQRRTYDDIVNDKIQRAKELFGEDIDTSELTVLGKLIRINAYDQALAYEELEQIYYSRFPHTASGQSLDRLLPFAAISRNQAESAVYTVEFEGTAGYVIEAGFLVGTEAELTFYTTQDVTIGEDGKCTATVCCTEPGTMGNVNASAINNIVNPEVDVVTVVGVACISSGVDEEDDPSLRTRFDGAVAGSGSCNANALRAALLRIPTVKFADVIENEDDVTDGDGRPPHSFQCYIQGGEDYAQEIAETIFDKRPLGIRTIGEKIVEITDASGNNQIVRYSTAQNVLVTVKVQLKTNALYPTDGETRVHTNVTEYINDLGIGASLVLNALYGSIYKVPGVMEVVSLQLSTDGGATYNTDNITVPKYGLAVCAAVVVEVIA